MNNVGMVVVHFGYSIPTFIQSSSQEIDKHSMFGLVLYRDYPSLHQSWKDLVLCGLITPKMCLKSTFSKLFINKGYFGRNLSNMNVLSCLVTQRERFPEKWRISLFCTFPLPDPKHIHTAKATEMLIFHFVFTLFSEFYQLPMFIFG